MRVVTVANNNIPLFSIGALVVSLFSNMTSAIYNKGWLLPEQIVSDSFLFSSSCSQSSKYVALCTGKIVPDLSPVKVFLYLHRLLFI